MISFDDRGSLKANMRPIILFFNDKEGFRGFLKITELSYCIIKSIC